MPVSQSTRICCFARLLVPGGDGIVLVEHAGLEDEVGEVLGGHFRVLREGIGGVLGEGPDEGAVGVALHVGLEELAARALEDGLAGGIDAAEGAGVAVGQDDDGDIGDFAREALDRADPGELLVGAVVQQGGLMPVKVGTMTGYPPAATTSA